MGYKENMNNNSDIPDGWSMPDDLAKKISEVLNKKSIPPEDELSDALGDMARDIALIEPNPSIELGGKLISLSRWMWKLREREKGNHMR